MYNDVFKNVALKHNVSVMEVKEEINKLILEACKNPNALINSIGSGAVPTTEEVIEYTLKTLTKSRMS